MTTVVSANQINEEIPLYISREYLESFTHFELYIIAHFIDSRFSLSKTKLINYISKIGRITPNLEVFDTQYYSTEDVEIFAKIVMKFYRIHENFPFSDFLILTKNRIFRIEFY